MPQTKMMETRSSTDTVNAIRDGNIIRCGMCKHKLMERVSGYNCILEGMEAVGWYEIKCKHKDNGKTCNTVNKVIL